MAKNTNKGAVSAKSNKGGEKIPADVLKRASAEKDPARSQAIIAAWRRSQIAAKGVVPPATTHAGQKGAPPPRTPRVATAAIVPAKDTAPRPRLDRAVAKINDKALARKASKDAPATVVSAKKKGTKRTETKDAPKGAPSVNGIKFAPGVECLIVRDRMGLEGVTEGDARMVPTDVVIARFMGYNPETGAYLFDDGRVTAGVWVEMAGKKDNSESADLTIWPTNKPKSARRASEEINARQSLWYGREDYQRAGLIMRAVSSKAEVFGEALTNASAKERALMVSALGGNPFEVFRGLAGDVEGQKGAVLKVWKKAHKARKDVLRETYTQAKSVRDALVSRFGEAVKVSSVDADLAAQKEAEETRKASKKAPEATTKNAPKGAKKGAKRTA